MGEDSPDTPAPLAPPPAPTLDLPTVPSVPEPAGNLEQEEPAPELPPVAPPSMGEDSPEYLLPLLPLLLLHLICHQLLPLPRHQNQMQQIHQVQ